MTSKDEFKEYVYKYFDGKTVISGDDLTVIIRAHLLVENILEKLLSKNLDVKVFEDRELTFNLKLKITQSMNLLGDLYEPIKTLNKMRNEFAHNIETKIQDMDLSTFIKLYENRGHGDDPVWKAALDNKKACFGIVIHYILGRLAMTYEQSSEKLHTI